MNFTLFRNHLVREPLVHFVLAGAVLFGLDHVISAGRDNPKIIVLGAEVEKEAHDIFLGALGREPSEKEMTILRERWIDNEVLYREGLALRVDQGDPTIRERVIFKALEIMQANLALPKVDDQQLHAWFEKNREKYDEPARFDFLEAVTVGTLTPDAVNKFVAALNTGAKEENSTQSGLRVFKARPRNTLVTSYGEPFTQALEKMPIGQWQALESREGLRVIRLEAKKAGEAVDYTSVQTKVYMDWKDDILQQQRTDAVRELGKKYTIKRVEAVK